MGLKCSTKKTAQCSLCLEREWVERLALLHCSKRETKMCMSPYWRPTAERPACRLASAKRPACWRSKQAWVQSTNYWYFQVRRPLNFSPMKPLKVVQISTIKRPHGLGSAKGEVQVQCNQLAASCRGLGTCWGWILVACCVYSIRHTVSRALQAIAVENMFCNSKYVCVYIYIYEINMLATSRHPASFHPVPPCLLFWHLLEWVFTFTRFPNIGSSGEETQHPTDPGLQRVSFQPEWKTWSLTTLVEDGQGFPT